MEKTDKAKIKKRLSLRRHAEISDFYLAWIAKNFCYSMDHKGLDIYKISKLFNHKDVQTTQKKYAHHCPESLRNGFKF